MVLRSSRRFVCLFLTIAKNSLNFSTLLFVHINKMLSPSFPKFTFLLITEYKLLYQVRIISSSESEVQKPRVHG